MAKVKPLRRMSLVSVRAFAVSAGIGFAAIALLSVTVGIPFKGAGFQLEIVTTAGFGGSGVIAGIVSGRIPGWFGLLIGLLVGLSLLPHWGTSSGGYGSIIAAAVAMAYFGWAVIGGSIGYAIGSYLRGPLKLRVMPPANDKSK
jgi:hypothetical protein